MILGFLEGWLSGSVTSSTSLFYAAMGETVVEKGGMINLGVEGSMLVGAVTAVAISGLTGNPLLGVLVAGMASAALNMILGLLIVQRRANQLASGLALMFLGAGVSAFLGKSWVGQEVAVLEKFPIPFLSEIPFLGQVLFQYDVLVYAIIPVAILIWWVLQRSSWGLHLRAMGEDRMVAFAAGSNTAWMPYQALLIGGFLGGIGGAHLSLSVAQAWNEGMTAGRGFIAVSLVIFAGWNPLRILLGALLFGGTLALQIHLQSRGFPVSPFLLDMLPYLFTLGVLLLLQKQSKNAMPQGLKSVFEQ